MIVIVKFILCLFCWFFFSSALATLAMAIYRNVTSGFLGWKKEVPICALVALFFTIWWLLLTIKI